MTISVALLVDSPSRRAHGNAASRLALGLFETGRTDTALLFFTDGLTWKQRKSDLRKIVDLQNNGDITRIYTSAMADRFEADLWQLKREDGL